MSDESELLDEGKPFSILAIVAFLFSLIGLLAILFVPFTPMAFAAIGLGILAKFFGRNNDYNGFSMFVALLAVVFGCFSVSAGMFSRTFANQSELARAQDLSEQYLGLVYKQDFDRLGLINSAEVPPEEFGRRKPTEQERFEFRKKMMKANATYEEIAALSEPPNWQFVRLETENDTPYYCTYTLVYRDSNRQKSPLYAIRIRRDQPKAGPYANPATQGREMTEEDFKVRWTVEFLEKMK